MTETLLRIYGTKDRTDWPRDWPGRVGVICLWRAGKLRGICPFHEEEELVRAAARACAEFSLEERDTPTYPGVVGFPSREIDQDTEFEISDALSLRFLRNEDDAEKANDFAVNFEFAFSEGLELHDLQKGAHPETEKGDRPVDATSLPGFVDYEGPDPFEKLLEGAIFRKAADGRAELHLPKFSEDGGVDEVDVLVSMDGVSVAIEMEQLLHLDTPPRTMTLPEGSLRWFEDGEEDQVSALVVRRGNAIIARPFPLLHSSGDSVNERKTETKKGGGGLARVFRPLVLPVCLLALTLGALHVAAEFYPREAAQQQPAKSTDALKELLFKGKDFHP